MQLLVSVANAHDARAALEGGADIVDAKDPGAGALGAVSLDTFRRIHAIVAATRPVSAALGDAADEATIERAARDFTAAGATFVKVGFSGVDDLSRLRSLISAAVSGVRRAGPLGPAGPHVVAVAFADRTDEDLSLNQLLEAASTSGALGVLIDTAHKERPGLRHLIGARELTAWTSRAHAMGLIVAAAGKLTIDDLPWVRDCGVDIAGVRGAACEDGRTSRVIPEKVRLLRAATAALPAPA